MPITEEIRQAAEQLGKQMAVDPNVQEFVSLKASIQQDPGLVDLENKLANLNQILAEREQTGGSLDRSIVEDFYELKSQLQDHPLLTARDNRLEIVKALFAQVALRMSYHLGIEYPTFAL